MRSSAALLVLLLHGSGALQLRTSKRASARARGKKREGPRSEVARLGIARVEVAAATTATAATAAATATATATAAAFSLPGDSRALRLGGWLLARVFSVDTTVRYTVYPWIVTVSQG